MGAGLRRGGPLVNSGVGRYLEVSQRPLHMLLFLAPLILLYEWGTWMYATGEAVGLTSDQSRTIRAYKMIVWFFDALGAGGLYLPGLALVVVLGVWHFLRRDSWEIHWGVPVVMLLESAVLALPLIVFGQVFARLMATADPGALLQNAGSGELEALSWQAWLTFSIGAGIYEELMFRMILIALVHTITVDLFRMSSSNGAIIALGVSAVAFAAYHDGFWAGPGMIDVEAAVFYLFSGLYFGGVYLVRGFGVVVGAHAMYDIAATLLLPSASGG